MNNAHDVSGQFEEHEYELLAPAITAIARSPEADQLCTALALVDGFQLDLVVCPAARDADALLVWLASELPKRRGHEVHFKRVRPDRGPDDARLEPTVLTDSILSQLEARRSDPAEATVVVVDATGYRSDEHPAWRWLFQRWNERRNYLAAVVAAPLLLLLPPDLEAVLPGDAPDLWSIRSVSVRLAGGNVAVPRGTIAHSDRFEPGALERTRAVVAELRAAGDARPSVLVPALRRLAEQELDNGHVSEAADVVHGQLAPLRPAIEDPLELAKVDRVEANVLLTLGRSVEALAILRERVLPAIERQGTAYQRALTYRAIAQALEGTGDLDGALRQLQEHALRSDEQMRDDHGRAETLGQIADVLAVRGDLDEALRIRQEVVPMFERLGDVREKAVAQAKIADILFAQGQLDEALRIWREEVLPVFERLGDVRSKALTLSRIADILFARGQLDEALRIRTEEELPVFERLGDVRSKAITQGKIADILFRRGQLDEALRIRTEEELPVYEQLCDAQSLYAGLMSYAQMLVSAPTHTRLAEAQACLRRSMTIADRLALPFPTYLRELLAKLPVV